MADVALLSGLLTSVHASRQAHSRVLWVSTSVGYFLAWDNSGGTFVAMKTTNGGDSYSEVDASNAPAGNPRSMGFYWEAQNGDPNDPDLGHVACLDATDNQLQHTTFDIGTDSWTAALADTGASITSVSGSSSQSSIDIAVNRAGDILIPWRADQDGEVGCMFYDLSTTSWTDVYTGSNDPWFGPYNTDDVHVEVINGGTDFDVAMYDESADIIWSRIYRAVEEDWTSVTSVSGQLTNNDNAVFALAFDWTNDQVGMISVNQIDNAANDIQAWTVTHDGSTSAPTVTAESNVITNDANKHLNDLCYEPIADEFYAIYDDGARNGTAVNVRWKTTDAGTISWSAESADYLASDRDYRLVKGFVITSAGGRFQPVVEDNDGATLYVSDSNSFDISGGVELTPSPAIITAAAPTPAVTTPLELTPSAVAITAGAPTVALTVDRDLFPDPSVINALAPNPSVDRSLEVTPDAVAITAGVPSVTLVFGKNILADPAIVQALAPTPALGFGAKELTPDPNTVYALNPDGTVTNNYGLTPDPAIVQALAPQPAAELDYALTPGPAIARALNPNPSITRTEYVTPDPAIIVAGAPQPALSVDQDVTPDPAVINAIAPDPLLITTPEPPSQVGTATGEAARPRGSAAGDSAKRGSASTAGSPLPSGTSRPERRRAGSAEGDAPLPRGSVKPE